MFDLVLEDPRGNEETISSVEWVKTQEDGTIEFKHLPPGYDDHKRVTDTRGWDWKILEAQSHGSN